MSRASALAVLTETGAPAGVGDDAPEAGAANPGAALGDGLADALTDGLAGGLTGARVAVAGAALSVGFLSLQPSSPRQTTAAHTAGRGKQWFISAQGCAECLALVGKGW